MPSQPTTCISSTCSLQTSSKANGNNKSPGSPIEVRDWALSILLHEDLETKLFSPKQLLDTAPGSAIRIAEPARSPGMLFRRRTKEEKLPKPDDLASADHRAICLHRFGGHELLAVEMIAWALLAFPDAPKSFRKALCHQLQEEQEHVRLYQNALLRFGMELGDLPLYKHFWTHIPDLDSPLTYLSCMNLTLEQANLDFAPMYGSAFLRVDDEESAALMAHIFHDEVGHVKLGWRWFERLREDCGPSWDAWLQHLPPLLHPARARGGEFRPDGRRQAGLPDDWITRMRDLPLLRAQVTPKGEQRRLELLRQRGAACDQQTENQ
jgi:uncharacterized ferritin-like protein (DUF455 family)